MNDILEYVISELSKKYDTETINGEKCFITKNEVFKVSYIKGLGGIIAEYAESKGEAKKNRYEDGDVHKGDNAETILMEILSEIE